MRRRLAGATLVLVFALVPVAAATTSTTSTTGTGGALAPGGGAVTGFTQTTSAQTDAAGQTAPTPPTDPSALVGVAVLDVVPQGYRLTGAQAQAIGDHIKKIVAIRKKNPGSYAGVFMKGPLTTKDKHGNFVTDQRWQISYYKKGLPLTEIGQVSIDDTSGKVLEAWTGFQVPWTMTRGYKGAFGHAVNSWWIWIPLCVLFFLPFFDWRRPLRWLHLDLLALLGFSAAIAYFNHAEIGPTVPINWSIMGYLLIRMTWIGTRRSNADLAPLRLLVPATWLIVATVFLLGFRISLNVTNSNVIDVGYGSLVGANLISHGEKVYDNFPKGIDHGDTYGPTTYVAYVPFEQALGFHGLWDKLPAAHGAVIAFDVLTVLLLWFLGRRIRGPTLGAALAYGWVAYPFTIFNTSTNSNDGLVALMLVVVLLVSSRPVLRGGAAALAGLTKFAPLALAPLLWTHERRVKPMILFLVGFAIAAVAISVPVLLHGPSLHEVYNRTLDYQNGRNAPFSPWGYPGGWGDSAEKVYEVFAVVFAFVVAVIPRRRDVVGLAALSAAVIIALEIGLNYWFYLYIVWFFPLVLVALLGRHEEPNPWGGPVVAPSLTEVSLPSLEPAPEPVGAPAR